MSNRGALFGSAATGPGSTGGNKHLVEMRAGKMNLKGHMVYPDKRKGLLYVYQSEDSLMHFCWQDRTTGVVEDDLIIFPDDCEYVKVSQCTTGRVYLLKFKSSNRRFFFWLQEPRTDKDEDNCKRINEYLNNPAGSVPSSNDQDIQSLLNNMSQSQLMQLLGGGQMGGLSSLLGTISRPSTGGSARTTNTAPAITHRTTVPTTPTTNTNTSTLAGLTTPQNASIPAVTPTAPRASKPKAETSSDTTPIQLADLQNYLQGIAPSQTTGVDLSTALTGDALSSIMSNAEIIEQLHGHLPAVDGNAQEQLRSTLQSPQFQQAVSQFSSALESGQLGPVVSQLVANPEAVTAANQGNMQDFVKALEKAKESSGGSASKDGGDKEKDKGKKEDDKDDDDEGMQLD